MPQVHYHYVPESKRVSEYYSAENDRLMSRIRHMPYDERFSLGTGKPGMLFNIGVITFLCRNYSPGLVDAYIRLRLHIHEQGAATGLAVRDCGRICHISKSMVSKMASIGLVRYESRGRYNKKFILVNKHREVALRISPLNRWIRLTPETWKGRITVATDWNSHSALERQFKQESLEHAYESLQKHQWKHLLGKSSEDYILTKLGIIPKDERFPSSSRLKTKDRQTLYRIRRIFSSSPTSKNGLSAQFAYQRFCERGLPKKGASLPNTLTLSSIRKKLKSQINRCSAKGTNHRECNWELFGNHMEIGIDTDGQAHYPYQHVVKIARINDSIQQRLVYRSTTAKILGVSIRTIDLWRKEFYEDFYAKSSLLHETDESRSHTRLVRTPGGETFMTPRQVSYETYCRPDYDTVGHPITAMRSITNKYRAVKSLRFSDAVKLDATYHLSEAIKRTIEDYPEAYGKTLSRLISEGVEVASDIYRDLLWSIPTKMFRPFHFSRCHSNTYCDKIEVLDRVSVTGPDLRKSIGFNRPSSFYYLRGKADNYTQPANFGKYTRLGIFDRQLRPVYGIVDSPFSSQSESDHIPGLMDMESKRQEGKLAHAALNVNRQTFEYLTSSAAGVETLVAKDALSPEGKATLDQHCRKQPVLWFTPKIESRNIYAHHIADKVKNKAFDSLTVAEKSALRFLDRIHQSPPKSKLSN